MHAQAIIHRDLKPGNVMMMPLDESATPRSGSDSSASSSSLGSRWRSKSSSHHPPRGFYPKVTDFGLATELEHDSNFTRTGAFVGTPSYMAPEQASGDPTRIGPAVDVYALGAILYESLTGRAPFRASTSHETIRQVINDEPAPPRKLSQNIPVDLDTIVLKCLSKSPSDRYQTASDWIRISTKPFHGRCAGLRLAASLRATDQKNLTVASPCQRLPSSELPNAKPVDDHGAWSLDATHSKQAGDTFPLA